MKLLLPVFLLLVEDEASSLIEFIVLLLLLGDKQVYVPIASHLLLMTTLTLALFLNGQQTVIGERRNLV